MMISLERCHCQVGEEELTRGRKQLRDRGQRVEDLSTTNLTMLPSARQKSSSTHPCLMINFLLILLGG